MRKESSPAFLSQILSSVIAEISCRYISKREGGWRKVLFEAPIWVFCLISLLIQAGAHNNDCVYVKEIQSISCASGKGMNEYGNTKCLFMAKENTWKQSKYERKQKKQSSLLSLKKPNVISRRTRMKIWGTICQSASHQSLWRWWSK